MAERLNGKQCRGFVVCDWLWCITCSSIENSARMKVGQNFLSLNSTYSRSSRTNGRASRVRSRTTVLLQGLIIIADSVMLIGRLFVGFLVIILNAGIARDCLPPCNNTMKEHCFSTNRHRFTCLFNHIQTH